MADENRKLIFELIVNDSKLGTELAVINDRLSNAKKNQKEWNKELEGLKEGTAEYKRAAANAADFGSKVRTLSEQAKIANQALKLSDSIPGSYNELKAKIAITRTELNNLSIGSDKYIQVEKELNVLLVQEVNIRKNQASLFQERIRQAVDESKAVSLSGEATKNMTQQLRELQRQLQNMEVGTAEFQKTAQEAGKLRDKIQDAKEAANALATESKFAQLKNSIGGVADSIKNLDFAEAADKSKALQDIASKISFSGAVQGVKDMGTAFINLAKTLLTNPLFLLAATITTIVLAIKELQEQEQEAFSASIKLQSERLKGYQDIHKAEEELAQARGQNIEKLRLNNVREDKMRADAIINTLESRRNLNGFLNEEDDKFYKENIKIAQDAAQSIKVIEAEAATERRKIREENLNQLKDLQINAIRDEENREIARINEDTKRRLKEHNKRGDLDGVSIALEKAITEDGERQITEIRKKFSDKRLKDREEARNKEVAANKAFQDEQKQRVTDELNEAKAGLENSIKQEESFFATQELIQKQRLADGAITQQQYEESIKQIKIDSLNAQVAQLQTAAETLPGLEQQISDKRVAIANAEVDAKIAANEKVKQNQQALLALEQQITQTRLDLAGTFVTGISGILSQDEKQRKQFGAVIKALAVAEIGINLGKELSAIAFAATAGAQNIASGGIYASVAVPLQSAVAITRAAFALAKITSSGFYEGGYTTPGNPREQATNLGARPYTYHKNEYVVPDRVLGTPAGAYHVQRLESMRKGTPGRIGLPGFADGGFASRSQSVAADSIDLVTNTVKEVLNNLPPNIVFVQDIANVSNDINRVEARAII